MHARKIAGALAIVVVGAIARPATAAPPNDPYFPRQWGLVDVQAEEAWTVTTGNAALIAIVDSGVDLTHPDLDANIVSYPDADFVDPGGICSHKKGQKNCTQDGAQDKNGHGTHVAGIAAAETGNGIGIAGVAPDAKILPVRVLDAEGSGTTQDVAGGIKYAADRGARVVNLSLGYDATGHVSKVLGNLRPLYAAIDYAVGEGAVVVVAAGNGPLTDPSGPGVPLCAEPALHPGVLCVGAVDQRDAPSWFGNFDAAMSSRYLVAPGGDSIACTSDIFSTYLRSGGTSSCSPEHGYEALSGTSMAAPFVSGVAGLLAGQGLTSQEIIDCLTSTADDLGLPGRDPVYGYGRVNAYRAVSGC